MKPVVYPRRFQNCYPVRIDITFDITKNSRGKAGCIHLILLMQHFEEVEFFNQFCWNQIFHLLIYLLKSCRLSFNIPLLLADPFFFKTVYMYSHVDIYMYNNINIRLMFYRTARICLCYFVICLTKYLSCICFYLLFTLVPYTMEFVFFSLILFSSFRVLPIIRVTFANKRSTDHQLTQTYVNIRMGEMRCAIPLDPSEVLCV